MTMEQTIFPNIIIKEIEASSAYSSRSLEFDPPAVGEGEGDLPGLVSSITDKVVSLMKRVNPVGEEQFTVTYHMEVGALTETGARAKARGLVRGKNPFEPDVIEVYSEEIDDEFMSKSGPMKVYRVSVEVEK